MDYAVLQLQGRVFMTPIDDPFRAADALLAGIKAKVIVVDFHAEATSEKVAMGWYLDGRVTAVLGTHTHVPTADERILPSGTAFQTDVGMSGPYDSIIGVEKDLVLHKFLTGMPGKFEAAKGNPKMCAALVTCDPATGRASANPAHHAGRVTQSLSADRQGRPLDARRAGSRLRHALKKRAARRSGLPLMIPETLRYAAHVRRYDTGEPGPARLLRVVRGRRLGGGVMHRAAFFSCCRNPSRSTICADAAVEPAAGTCV